ncbi:MAG: SpoIIE family protein phosphatase [Burkholderiaceae bacterium]
MIPNETPGRGAVAFPSGNGPVSQPQAGSHVLIVDDLEVNRDLLARRVRRLGLTYAFACTGREALDSLRAHEFDLVLLDITMPDMDGYEALARIKADPELHHIPVIMVTAIDGLDSLVRCLESGADDYITKPFNPVLLRARIESSLNKKRVADLNARLLQSLSREMAIAARIQIGFLPDALPRVPGWPIAACCTPARQVGGDFYDALILPDGRLAFVLADVCDKGVGAALYMGLFRSLLRISLQQAALGEPAEAVLARATSFTNDYIATVHSRDNMFATVFAGILEPGTGRMHYANAGHDAPILWRGNSSSFDRLSPEGPALGMLPGASQRTRDLQLNVGDRLLVFTDGLPEALNEHGTAFGEEKLLAALASEGSPRAVLATLNNALVAHVDGYPAHDDVTMLCLGARSEQATGE